MANTQIELPESFRDANNYRNQYTTLQTNLNVSPYYDDFNVDSQFYRILFKPGYAVQARELTQIQSMLQNQVTKFGKHVFKEGSVVLGAQFAIEKYDYVKVFKFIIGTKGDYHLAKNVKEAEENQIN